MKILADQQIPFAKEAFQEFGDVTLIHGRDISRESLHDTDILLLRSITKANEDLLSGTPVKFVGTATSGFDHIDQTYLQQNGIAYGYAPGSNARSVAEYIFSALFVLEDMTEETLVGKTVAVIGYGHVGSTVARFLQSLNIRCIINDPPLQATSDSDMFCTLQEALQADIITLHVPLEHTGEYPTENLIDAKQLASMKDGAILINTSRGGVVNEQALKSAIDKKGLKTIIDVWQNEPLIDPALLEKTDIATPHIAGYSTDGKLLATDMLYRLACNCFELDGKWDRNKANRVVDHKELMLDESMSDYEIVKNLVLSSYDVRSDSVGLSALKDMEESQRGLYFDGLRKDYPARYEFMHTRLLAKTTSPELESMLSVLGFQLECLS